MHKAQTLEARGTNERADVRCPSCGSSGMSVFYEVPEVPAHSLVLFPTREAALDYPKASIRLAFCDACGFVSNIAFDSSLVDYTQDYEETQAFSPRFNAFAHELAKHMVDRYDLHDKSIFEIGSGKGEFLVELCELGHNRGIGLDPSYMENRLESEALERIEFIRDFFTDKTTGLSGDLVACRHTLEHIWETADFVSLMRRSTEATPGAVAFLEVPDIYRVLRELAFWDIYHEHCSYYTLGSLARVFRHCGFELLDLYTQYGDQYLMVEARPGDPTGPSLPREDDLEATADAVELFRNNVGEGLGRWRNEIEQIRERGQRAVVWGSSSKGVSFLTTLGVTDEIGYVVDIDPFRQNTYMAGSGHRIVGPEAMIDYRPDVVIAMNPIYLEEIGKQLEGMGLKPSLTAV